MPNWAEVQLELTKHRTLTLAQLWKEYIAAHPEGYQYSRFCDLYRSWRYANVDPVMRHNHKAGDRLFVDYSGKKPCVVDLDTGDVRTVELLVAVLGASNYLCAEATETQKARDFCGSVRRTLEFLGGVPRAIVLDKSTSLSPLRSASSEQTSRCCRIAAICRALIRATRFWHPTDPRPRAT